MKQLVRDLKKENKSLQKNAEEKRATNSDSDNPPWEHRKLQSQLTEKEHLVLEKNSHIEQLLDDCNLLERENKKCQEEYQTLTRQLQECARQLQQATENSVAKELKLKGK